MPDAIALAAAADAQRMLGRFGFLPLRTRPYTPGEFGKHFGVSADSVIRSIEEGDIAGFPYRRGRTGRRSVTWRIPAGEALEFIGRQLSLFIIR
jgi:hypothetical protein